MLLVQEFQASQCQGMGEYGGKEPLASFPCFSLNFWCWSQSGRNLCKVDLAHMGHCYAMFLSISS